MLGIPHNPSEQELIVSNLWKYVEEGKMFMCTSKGILIATEFFCAPSTTVARKLPDRTLSIDKRLIFDGRRVNLRCSKFGYWGLKRRRSATWPLYFVSCGRRFLGCPSVELYATLIHHLRDVGYIPTLLLCSARSSTSTAILTMLLYSFISGSHSGLRPPRHFRAHNGRCAIVSPVFHR